MTVIRSRPFKSALERLRAAGLRPTRQRLALAKLLFDGHDRHVYAEDLHKEALAASFKLSLATVYNTLHQFTEVGLMREIVVDSGRFYFDTNVSNHHHFFHEQTGVLEDIPGDMVLFSQMPDPPAGTSISRVEVIVRLRGEP